MEACHSTDMICLVHRLSNADAPTLNEDGELVFAKPCEVQIPFSQALRQIQAEGLNPGEKPDAGVRYAQTRM